MRIFIERFLLAILAAIAVLLAVTNPMGWSTTPRIVGVIAVVILAAIAACFAEKYGNCAGTACVGSGDARQRTDTSIPQTRTWGQRLR